MRKSPGTDERTKQLDRIRAVYAEYARDGGRGRLWDLSNRGYARFRGESQRAIAHLVAAELPGGGRVLDVGCGTGELAEAVRQLRPDVDWTGVDLLREAIELAMAAHPWASWLHSTADELPFREDGFDAAIASTLFSSLPSEPLAAAVASEIARVLKRHGALVWYDLRYGNPANRAVHGVSSRDIMRLFPGWELHLRSMTLMPPLARRLGVLTPVLYPVLSSLPPLRSHLIGRLYPPAPR